MFGIEWFWVYLLAKWHLASIAWSLYMHRSKSHNLIEFSPALAHIFRFLIWINGQHGGRHYVEKYYVRHKKHHLYSDTEKDPQSPFYFSLRELLHYSKVSDEEIASVPSTACTPNDWIEQNLYLPYLKYHELFRHVIALVLFGIWGLILSILWKHLVSPWWGTFWGNWAYHKIGFTYAGNLYPPDRSKIVCPWGIVMAGEELHANHHNHPARVNYRVRWFEIDLGYLYARLFVFLGLGRFCAKPI